MANDKKKKRPTRRPKSAPSGLNKVEKKEVKNMLQRKKEVYYIPAFSYAFGRTVSAGFKQAQQTSYPAFGHTTSGSVSMCGLVVGNYLGGIASTVNTSYAYLLPTGGIKLDGDASAPVPIIGDKAHVKSMKLNMRITATKMTVMNDDDKTVRPLSFRVLAFKIKGNRPANIVPNLRTGSTTNPSLFLDNINNDVGINDTVVPYEIDNLRVNTQNIEVVRDIKFELDQPIAASYAQSGEYYTGLRQKTVKDLSIWLPCPKAPVKYDDAKTPTNWDYRTYVMVICHRSGGTYTKTDGYWGMESNMISRVQEY